MDFWKQLDEQDKDGFYVLRTQGQKLSKQEKFEGLSGKDLKAESCEVDECLLSLEVAIFEEVFLNNPHQILSFFKVRQKHKALSKRL